MFSNRFLDLYSAKKKNLSQTHQNFNFGFEINPGSKRLKHICGMGELMGTVCQIQVVKIAKPARIKKHGLDSNWLLSGVWIWKDEFHPDDTYWSLGLF